MSPSANKVRAPLRPRHRLLAAGGLSVAAVVAALAAGRGHDDQELLTLTSRNGDVRTLEPRLAWRLPYAPCLDPSASPARGAYRCPGAERPLPRASRGVQALSRLERAAARERSPEALRRLADALLLSGTRGALERAVAILKRLEEEAPGNPEIQSDLGAAYLLRAGALDQPLDLLRALGAMDRALERERSLPEAAFNRAIVLERLMLRRQAVRAWRAYLADTPEAGWASEAAARLESLVPAAGEEIPPPSPLQLRVLPWSADPEAIGDGVRSDAQRYREVASEDLLGGWADRLLAGDRQAAAEQLDAAHLVGQALLEHTGDCTVSRAVEAARAAETAREASSLKDLAQGYRSYRDGSGLFRRLLVDEAAGPLRESATRLGTGSNPIGAWAEVGVAGVAFYRGRYEEAVDGFRRVLDRAEADCLPALAGKARWGLGLSRLRQGSYADSLGHYGRARTWFEKAEEAENLAAVHTLIAENLAVLGRRREAWRHRFRALPLLVDRGPSLRLHNLLWEAASAAAQEGYTEAALALQGEGVDMAEAVGDPRLTVEALLWRSKIHLARGDTPASLADLDQARRHHRESPPGEIRNRLDADLALAEGQAWRRLNPRQAIPSLTLALRFYQERTLSLDEPEAFLGRARAFRALGDPLSAVADLTAAIERFEAQRSVFDENPLRNSFTDTMQSLFDEWIELEVEDRADPGAALFVSERARRVPVVWREEDSHGHPIHPAVSGRRPADRGAAASLPIERLPPDLAIVEYALVRNRLYIWTLSRDGIDFESRAIEARELSRLLQGLVEALRVGAPETELDRRAEELGALLIPEAVGALPPSTSLAVVPDKLLGGIPFSVLRRPGEDRQLIEERPVFFATSAGALLEDPPAAPTAEEVLRTGPLLVADPAYEQGTFPMLAKLPRARAEIEEVAALYRNSNVLAGPEATRRALLTSLDRHPVLHFAGHAVVNVSDPLRSFLPVAPTTEGDEGAVFAVDLGARPLRRLRLVVLSACHTLASEPTRVGSLTGLARPLLDAGASAVVATLWEVDDRVSSELLPRFHRSLLGTGDAALALREAQLALASSTDPMLASRSAWAAFALVGNLRTAG